MRKKSGARSYDSYGDMHKGGAKKSGQPPSLTDTKTYAGGADPGSATYGGANVKQTRLPAGGKPRRSMKY